MNWFMIRQCPSAIALIGSNVGSTILTTVGMTINGDVRLATKILLEAVEKWSTEAPDPSHPVADSFWAGHRWGQSGLDNLAGTDWPDILRYYLAVQAIKAKCDLDPTVWITDIRYWVDVHAV